MTDKLLTGKAALDNAIETLERRYAISLPIVKRLRAGYLLRVMEEHRIAFDEEEVVGADPEMSDAWLVVCRKYGIWRNYPI